MVCCGGLLRQLFGVGVQRIAHLGAPERRNLVHVVVLEASETVHRDVHQHFGLVELDAQSRVLLYHKAAHPLRQREVVHVEPLGDERCNDVERQRTAVSPARLEQLPGLRLSAPVRPAHVDSHQHIASHAACLLERQRIDHSSVDEYHVAAPYGVEEQRQRDRRAYGIVEASLAEHHLATVFPVGGNGLILNRQVLDSHVGHNLFQRVDDLLALHQMVYAQREVEQREHLSAVDGLHPLLELSQAASGIHSADERAHGASGHAAYAVALLLQFLDSPNVGQSARTAARQCQSYISHGSQVFRFKHQSASSCITSSRLSATAIVSSKPGRITPVAFISRSMVSSGFQKPFML